MLATRVRESPWRARCGPRSVGRVTTSVPSDSLTRIGSTTVWRSSPFGPATVTFCPEMSTETPSGRGIDVRPMRLIARFSPSPDRADHFAAHAAPPRLVAGDDALGGRDDRDAHAAEHLRDRGAVDVDPPARLGDALQAADHPAAVAVVLQAHHELGADLGVAEL